MREANEELVTMESTPIGNEVERISFKDLFHAKLPEEVVVDCGANYGDTDEPSDSMPNVAHFSETPLYRFHIIFRQVLNEKYGYLHEKFLFGEAALGENGTILLLDDFEQVYKCTCLSDFTEFFQVQFCSLQSRDKVENLQQYFSALYDEIISDSTDAQIQRLILDKVTMFCYYLIDSRIRCMQTFENLEKELHEEFTGYDLLSKVKCIDKEFTKLLDELKVIIDDYDNIADLKAFTRKEQDIYARQIKIYQHTLLYLKQHSWIKKGDCADVEYLLKSEHNHFSYLHEHIVRLRKLLLPFKKRYHVSESSDGSGHRICSVQMVAGTMGGALHALKELISKSKPNEIRFYAETALYGDVNLEGKNFQGVNIACIAPIFVNKRTSDKLWIVTDGKPLDGSCVSNTRAKDGANGTKQQKNGKDGADGRNGRYGNAGGHILVVANNIHRTDFSLSANGSCGEDGQAGGHGGIGYTPDKVGRDGDSPNFTKGWLETKDTVIINFGTDGDDGGKGGNAGWAGASGKSGISGKIEWVDLQNDSNCDVEQNVIEECSDGDLGIPGEAGLNTRHGRDRGAYAKSPGFGGKFVNFFTGKEKRKITQAAGKLEHHVIPDNHGSGSNYEREGKGKPREILPENHPDFCNRGRQKRGDKGKVKVNSEMAKENKVISKHACFQALYNQCRDSIQHWNVNSHNQFLSAFAQRIGESHQYSMFVSITHSERMKFSSALWIERIQKQSEAMQSHITTTHQAHHSMQTQVMLMKDFDEGGGYRKETTGFLGFANNRHQPLTLDISSLETAKELKLPLRSISIESLLLVDTHNEVVKKLAQLDYPKQAFVMVQEAKLHAIQYEFIIISKGSGDTRSFYYHHRTMKLRISDTHILEILKGRAQKLSNEPEQIERDDHFYPKMVDFIRSKSGDGGDDLKLPFSSRQLMCVQQLQLLVAIRKSYNAIGRTLTELRQRQGLLKLYGQYIDDVLLSKSSLALLNLEQDMLANNLLIQPLDVSWITEDSSRCNDCLYINLCQSLDAFNTHPTLPSLLETIVAFYTYHTHRVSQTLHRLSYITHLSTAKCLSGLHRFCTQLCQVVFILSNKTLVNSNVHNLPCMAFSETILHKISLTACTPEPNYKHYIGMLQLQRPLVCTVVDEYVREIDSTLKAYLNIDQQQLNLVPQNPSSHALTFEESCAAFETLRCNQTMLIALQVYVKCSSDVSKSATEHNDRLLRLLEWLYYALHDHTNNFDAHISVTDLAKRLKNDGLDILELLRILNILIHRFEKQNPLLLQHITALVHILEQFKCTIISPSEAINLHDDDKYKMDSRELLMSIMQYFKDLRIFCKKGLEGLVKNGDDENVCDAMAALTDVTADICSTLLTYPVASQANNLCIWEISMKAIQDALQSKTKSFNQVSVIRVELEKLQPKLESITTICSTLQRFHHCMVLIRHADDLQNYSKMYYADDKEKVKLFVQSQLALNEKFLGTRCIDTLSGWFCPELVLRSSQRITIVTERLMPVHDIFFVATEPQESLLVEKPIVYLYPDLEFPNKWQLASQTPGKSMCFRDINIDELNDDYLASLLSTNVRKHLEVHDSLEITVEQAASLLGKLHYEEEMTIQFSVYFNEQMLVDETNSNFSLLVVHMQTGEVEVYNDPTDAIASIKHKICEKDVLIIQGECNSEFQNTLTTLKNSELEIITDQQISLLSSAKAMCLIRNPGQPILLRTVTHCGDKVEYDFAYQLPLITDLTNKDVGSFSEQFEPLTEVLNLHDHFSMNMLNSALSKVFETHQVSLCQNDISPLVRSIRSHFVCGCFASSKEGNEMQKLIAMQHPLKLLLESQCDSPIVEEMYLIGLESFSNFLLRQEVESTSDVAKKRKMFDTEKTNKNNDDKLWKAVLENGNPTCEDAKLIYMAYTYLECPDEIDLGLLDDTVPFTYRLEMYSMIERGLHYLREIDETDSVVRKSKLQGITVKQALQQILWYQNRYQIYALQEVCQTLKDENNLGDLFRIIETETALDTVQEDLSNYLMERPLKDKEACILLLKDHHFHDYVYKMMLTWCMEQQSSL
jgi:hypothetical protein